MVVRTLCGLRSRGASCCDALAIVHRHQVNNSTPRGVAVQASAPAQDCYLVDSASSHMLVSKIKPCMSKYKQSIL